MVPWKNFDEYVEYLGLEVTPEQRIAAHQLEARGQEFLIDFGIKNCEDILWRLMEEEEADDGKVERTDGPQQLPE